MTHFQQTLSARRPSRIATVRRPGLGIETLVFAVAFGFTTAVVFGLIS